MKKHFVAFVFVLANLGLASSAQAGFIAASVTINEDATPGNYTFSFSNAITPLTGTVAWTAQVSATLVDGPRGDGVTMAPLPFGTPTIYEFFANNVSVATDLLGTVTSSYSATYTGFFDCGAGCSSLQMNFHFSTSSDDDFENIFGRLELLEADAPVDAPEPATAALFGIALLGLAASRKTRNSKAAALQR